MKSLILKIVLPLTVISFFTFTKWWYALPVDAPDTLFTGFPLAFTCPGWHTSLSLQIFVMELIIDIMTYFLFWLVLIFCVDRYLVKIKTPKWVTIVLRIISGVYLAFAIVLALNPDNLFYMKRPFDMQVMETGYEFIWEVTQRPDYDKYFPKEDQHR